MGCMAVYSESSKCRSSYTSAYFDMVRTKSEKKLSFPEQNLVNGVAPSNDIQRMILFFKLPLAYPDNSAIQYEVEEERFLKKILLSPFSHGYGLERTSEQKEQTLRSLENIRTAVEILKGGFGDEKRRTGERYIIHPLRVFARGISEIEHIGLNHMYIFNTTSLVRLLHDCREDFKNFEVTYVDERTINDPALLHKKTIQRFKVTFDGQPSGSEYFLEMEPQEKELFDLQMEAVNIPSSISEMPNNNKKTKAQVLHLFSNVSKVYEKFGSMAAYQTLKIKYDDRMDNIFTYFETKNNGNPKEKFEAKLQETIKFFTEVEKKVHKYFYLFRGELAVNGRKKIDSLNFKTIGSLIAFCYYMLNGGTFQEIFQGYIDMKREEVVYGISVGQLLIPDPRPSPPPPHITYTDIPYHTFGEKVGYFP